MHPKEVLHSGKEAAAEASYSYIDHFRGKVYLLLRCQVLAKGVYHLFLVYVEKPLMKMI